MTEEKTNKNKLTNDNEDHAKQLDPRAQQRAEDHGILRWPEDITVDILPSRLLHSVLLSYDRKMQVHEISWLNEQK